MSEPARLLTLFELSVIRANDSRPEVDTISLSVEAEETVVVLGEAGSGKAALMRALNGSLEEGEAVSGTIRFGGQGEGGQIGRGPLRVAYLPGPSSHPLSPNASAISQLSRIIARRIRAPLSSGRAEFVQEIGRLEGAPPLSAFDKHVSEIAPETLSWGLIAAALAQAPGLILVDHLFEGLAPREARALEKALLAAKARLHCAIFCATMTTETAIRLGGRLVVMRQGRIVEEGPLTRLMTSQAHAYTQSLFRESASRDRSSTRGLAVVQALGITLSPGAKSKSAARRNGELNFELRRGASLALIGEEGSGRHNLVRLILGMKRLEKGRVIFDAVDTGILTSEMMTRLRRRVAVVAGADDVLDPRMSLWETVAEPLRAHLGLERQVLGNYRDAALRRVGLASLSGQLPISALSVFDRRRLQVARAIVTAPALAIIDEPFHGLDAFAQSVIRDLLQSFREEEGPAFIVITSDFSVAKMLAEDAMVFRDGEIIERGAISDMLRSPKNVYTRALVEASQPEAQKPVSEGKKEAVEAASSDKPAEETSTEKPASQDNVPPAENSAPQETPADEKSLVKGTL